MKDLQPQYSLQEHYPKGWYVTLLLTIGLGACFFGFLIIIAWYTYATEILQYPEGSVPVQYNTAICFILSGLALIFCVLRFNFIAKLTSSLVIFIAGLTLVEYLFNLNVGIDTFLFKPYIYAKTSHLGRMAPNSALCFTFLGLSLYIMSTTISYPIRPFIVCFLSSTVIGTASIGLMGYLLNWEIGYAWINFTHMAFQSSIGLLILGIAMLILAWFPRQKTKNLFKLWLPVHITYSSLLVVALILWCQVNTREEGHVQQITEAQANRIESTIRKSTEDYIGDIERLSHDPYLWNRNDIGLWKKMISRQLESIPGVQYVAWVAPNKRSIVAEMDNGSIQSDYILRQLDQTHLLSPGVNETSPTSNVIYLYEPGEKDTDFIIYTTIFSNHEFKGYLVILFDAFYYFNSILRENANPEYSISVRDEYHTIYQRGNQKEMLNKERMEKTVLPLLGTRWTIAAWPSQESLDEQKLSISLLVLLMAFFHTFVTAFSIYLARVTKDRSIEIQRSQRLMQSIIDGATALIYVKGIDGSYLIVNEAFLSFYNLTEDEVIGHTDWDFMSEAKASQCARADKKAIYEKAPVSKEEILHNKPEGVDRTFLTTRFPLLDEEKVPYAVCGVATDITARRISEKKLEETLRQMEITNKELETARIAAEEANVAKSTFLACMSHEIRTPLNGITGIAALLENSELNPKQQHYVSRIILSGQVLLEIINDILDFSKIEANELHLEYVSNDLHLLTKEVIDLLSQRAEDKNLELSLFVDIGYPCNVYIDGGRLRQILTNLIGNAIKFTKEGKVTLSVTRKDVFPNRATFRFEVIDTGIGIPESKQKTVFEKFSQADNSTTRKFGGTGLGLTISKQLVELMNGRIGVASEIDNGSTFWFEIPCEIDNKKNESETIASEEFYFSELSILIADHDENCRKLMKKYTELKDIDFTGCNTGKIALEILIQKAKENQYFDYIFLDKHLSDIDTLELIKEIQQNPIYQSPNIILTATASELNKIDPKIYGLYATLNRPLNLPEIHETLTLDLKNAK
ncbi:MAG: hypothetical protein Tsb0021_03240 [Chlamydiales bacterium]